MKKMVLYLASCEVSRINQTQHRKRKDFLLTPKDSILLVRCCSVFTFILRGFGFSPSPLCIDILHQPNRVKIDFSSTGRRIHFVPSELSTRIPKRMLGLEGFFQTFLTTVALCRREDKSLVKWALQHAPPGHG